MRIHRANWGRHPAVRSGSQLSLGERAADRLKHGFGTWTALLGVLGTIVVWVALQYTGAPWDIYPFILLNLVLSCLAAVQGIILQISANRGDRISSEVAAHTAGNTEQLVLMSTEQLGILRELRQLRAQVAEVSQLLSGGK